jgi:hypothetical protein
MLGAYPCLTKEEFTIACKALESRCHDRLNGTTWQSIRWTGQELQIKQQRELKHGGSHEHGEPGMIDGEDGLAQDLYDDETVLVNSSVLLQP